MENVEKKIMKTTDKCTEEQRKWCKFRPINHQEKGKKIQEGKE